MTSMTKLILAALTAWPVIYFFGFLLGVLVIFISNDEQSVGDIGDVLVPLHIGTMLVTIGMVAFYIVHAFRNRRIREDHRLLWVIAIFAGNIFVMPIYWYLYVWRGSATADPIARF
jgi:threonine/homoserine/homoserine lactone efflux protein